MNQSEEELLIELDVHDELVARCARGAVTWKEFEAAYDSFYPRYPLDGHESDAEELLLLKKHAARITLHRRIWEEVLTRMTGAEHLHLSTVIEAGFIGPTEAMRRIQVLAAAYLKL